MADEFINASTFNAGYPVLPVQIGVRSTRLDTAVLNITCYFSFTGSARGSDDGKTAVVTARIPNSNCSTCEGWTGMVGDNGGGYIGLMLGRDADGNPTILSFADYNRRTYYAQMASIPRPTRVASLFPIVDMFETDGDLTTSEEALEVLTTVLGINTPTGSVLPSGWGGRRVGVPWGAANKTSVWGRGGVLGVGGQYRKSRVGPHTVPCYTPNSSCTMHDYTVVNATNADIVNATDILGESAATFGAPVTPGSIVASALADEPGWHAPFWVPVDTSSIVSTRWKNFLVSHGMTPALLGVASWDAVIPVSDYSAGTPRLSVTTRRLFYWSIRFILWDSCRYISDWTAALQTAAVDDALQVSVPNPILCTSLFQCLHSLLVL
jgi:hypothetical protein